jgi:hypothetical protein
MQGGALKRDFCVVDIGDRAGGTRNELVSEFLESGKVSTEVRGGVRKYLS